MEFMAWLKPYPLKSSHLMILDSLIDQKITSNNINLLLNKIDMMFWQMVYLILKE